MKALGDYYGGVPPLPIPNREVKTANQIPAIGIGEFRGSIVGFLSMGKKGDFFKGEPEIPPYMPEVAK